MCAFCFREREKKYCQSKILFYSSVCLEFIIRERILQAFSTRLPSTNKSICWGLDIWTLTHIHAYLLTRETARSRAPTIHIHMRARDACSVRVNVIRASLGAASCHQRCQFTTDRRSSVRPDERVFGKEIIDLPLSPIYAKISEYPVCRSQYEMTARRGRTTLCFV